MNSFQLNYKQFGERALLIEWPQFITQEILSNRIAFEKAIRINAADEPGNLLQDIIPAYNSLNLIYQQKINSLDKRINDLKQLYAEIDSQEIIQNYRFHIPVCYERVFAADMKLLAETKGKSVSDIINLHIQSDYTIYFIGFLPGFLYLGGLDALLHTPRKMTPSLSVPKGAIAIGGEQTGIYPQQSPGGWHVIGNTPIEFFNKSSDSPCFAYAGDQIKFVSIDLAEYKLIQMEVEEGRYQIKKEFINA